MVNFQILEKAIESFIYYSIKKTAVEHVGDQRHHRQETLSLIWGRSALGANGSWWWTLNATNRISGKCFSSLILTLSPYLHRVTPTGAVPASSFLLSTYSFLSNTIPLGCRASQKPGDSPPELHRQRCFFQMRCYLKFPGITIWSCLFRATLSIDSRGEEMRWNERERASMGVSAWTESSSAWYELRFQGMSSLVRLEKHRKVI